MRELTTVVGFEVRGRQTAEMPAAVIVYVFSSRGERKEKLGENRKSVGEKRLLSKSFPLTVAFPLVNRNSRFDC